MELQQINDKLSYWLNRNNHLPRGFFDLANIKFKPDIDDDSWKMLKNWDEFNDQYGFILWGPAGVGKSLLLKRLCIRVLNKLAPYSEFSISKNVLFIPMTVYMTRLKKFDDSDDIEERALNSTFLFLDDIGVEHTTEFAKEKLFTILDVRVSKNLPTFITTNLNFNDMKDKYGERIHSRIKELCVPINVKGTDKRSQILADRMKDLLSRPEKDEKIEMPKKEEINQENIDKIKSLLQPKEF